MRILSWKLVFIGWLVLTTANSPFFVVDALAADEQPSSQAEAERPAKEKEPAIPVGPADDYDRGTPRTAVKGFFTATRDGKFDSAAAYLDLGQMPWYQAGREGSNLARELKIVLDRSLKVDPEKMSADPKGNLDDGLEPGFDSLGRIKMPQKTIDILIERVPREDGVLIWKISSGTVADIPILNAHFGFRPGEEYLSRFFPDVVIYGWQLWQYAALIIGIILAYLVAYVLSRIIRWFIKRRRQELGRQMEAMGFGPVQIILWVIFVNLVINQLGPSSSLQTVLNTNTLGIIAVTWAVIRLVKLGFNLWAVRLIKKGGDSAVSVLKPVRSIVNIFLLLLALLVWLGNLGFNVGALLAGLGVGGIAIALAAQDSIKNLLGCIMILLDKPYQVGQRIVVKGHDGVVEEIGLRSTKMRLLTGHQVSVPNDQMAMADIENIERRPHIRRITNIAIRLDTPLEKVEKAVGIIEDILADHEGMDPDWPPKVFFNELNRDSLNIIAFYWYHPPDYWAYMTMSQRVNKQILAELAKAGIQLALPSKTVQFDQQNEGMHEPPRGEPRGINLSS